MKLELRGITKRFGPLIANDSIDLTIEEGHIHALLGENGAGKSTLMNVLYGMHAPDEGQILIDGEPVTFKGPGDAVAAGIGMVHQHFMLIPVFTVAESIALGFEPTGPAGIISRERARQTVREVSARFGFDLDPDALIEDLPVGAQQRVEIVKALSRQAKVLILDEPTAVLTPQETDELMTIMRQLAEEKGLGLVSYTISHHTRQSAIGLPVVTEQLFDGRPQKTTNYTMSEIVASVYEMMEKSGKREGILFLDEINTVSETLAPTMLQFLQYKTFGTHRVPEGWVIVTAGNPPEYNRAVRDFDVVTKDRVRELRVTADYGVWKGYALQRGMHGAVLAFLDLEPEAFFFVRAGEAGKRFVTARGWEDLSDSLKAYEALGLSVTEGFMSSFLHDTETAEKFYRYYLLYRKYEALYNIAAILSGEEKADAARLKKTGFDEKLSFIALLASALGERFRKWQQDFRVQKEVFAALKRVREAEESGGSVIAALSEERFLAAQRLSTERAADALSPEREQRLEQELARLKGYEALLSGVAETEAFSRLREAFAADEAERKRREAETAEALSAALRFTAEGFGEGQELALFLTELNANRGALAFADETGHEDYARYNQLLLLRDRRETLKEEVMRFL